MSVPVPAAVLDAMREWAGRQVALVDYSAASEVLVRSFVDNSHIWHSRCWPHENHELRRLREGVRDA